MLRTRSPLLFLWTSASRVRSPIPSRSHWLTAPMIVMTSLPAAELVSSDSATEINATFFFSRSSKRPHRSFTDRVSLSSLATITAWTLPPLTSARRRCSPGLFKLLADSPPSTITSTKVAPWTVAMARTFASWESSRSAGKRPKGTWPPRAARSQLNRGKMGPRDGSPSETGTARRPPRRGGDPGGQRLASQTSSTRRYRIDICVCGLTSVQHRYLGLRDKSSPNLHAAGTLKLLVSIMTVTSKMRTGSTDGKRKPESGKREQIETDAYRTAPQEIETAQRLVNISDADPTNDGNPEIAVTRRCWRNLWLYKRPSSLGLGDFEEWIDPEVDIQRTFDHVYGVTKPSPVLLYQLPTATVHQPNGFVRIGARRAAQRAKRDAEDRETAVHQDTGDDDGRARGTPPPAGRVPPAVRARLPGRRPGLRQPGRLAPEARFSFRDRVAALPPPEAAGRAESALAAPHAHIGAAGRRGAAAGGLRAPWPFLDPHDPGNLRSHDPWPGRRCGRFGGKTTDRKSTR